jgi:mRNA interferase MazF
VVALPAGAVVPVRFPFSDLSQTKLRPAVVLADAGRGDFILCQVTSQPYGDPRAIQLDAASLASGSLRATSCARPANLFTANLNLMTNQVATLKPDALQKVAQAVVKMLNVGATP